ncbi:hypothetical protein JM93_02510 [Roseibium hamelinense]|uniref:Uncharacterized protein n=1 Tax=Roseibium hamelinense TaxID=150831 RepID=A0A562T0Z0_9HYPH|nr:hypothetical protein [Roseibium hamelinense]MTI44643.1 hypothetical protein [Roseibium hamelinense]TWI87269.1 hypothetical protein JM93_02510 [Roseibium hamelinense]
MSWRLAKKALLPNYSFRLCGRKIWLAGVAIQACVWGAVFAEARPVILKTYTCAVKEFRTSDPQEKDFAAVNQHKVFEIEDRGSVLVVYTNGPGVHEGRFEFDTGARTDDRVAGSRRGLHHSQFLDLHFETHRISGSMSLTGAFGVNKWQLECGLIS